jgi:predicted dienelactone hydrolase
MNYLFPSSSPIIKSEQIRMQINGDWVDLYYPTCHPSVINSHHYPIALFLQGFEVDKSYYSQFATQIARCGFVVLVPNHRPLDRSYLASELKQIIEIFEEVKQNVKGLKFPVSQWIDLEKLVLLGHSCGGITGIEAICNQIHIDPITGYRYQRPPELAAGVFFGSNALSRQDQSQPIKNIEIPIALIAGNLDTITPPEMTQQAYERIEISPKAYMTLEGVNHYGITDVPQPEAGAVESCAATIEQSVAIQTIANWASLFLNAYLFGNIDSKNMLSNPVVADIENAKVFLEHILENS